MSRVGPTQLRRHVLTGVAGKEQERRQDGDRVQASASRAVKGRLHVRQVRARILEYARKDGLACLLADPGCQVLELGYSVGILSTVAEEKHSGAHARGPMT